MDWFNLYGFILILLIMLPNIYYAAKVKNFENKCKNIALNILEQAGRYGSMFLSIFNIGILEYGFRSSAARTVWILITVILVILYYIEWIRYFICKMRVPLSLALIPSTIFILNGIFERHILLIVFGLIFTIGHTAVTAINRK